MISRKSFLKQASLLSTVLLVSPSCMTTPSSTSAEEEGVEPGMDIGLQLYTLREQIGADVAGIMAKVAAAGYTSVETYGYSAKDLFWGLTPVEFDGILKANNIVSPSGHYDLGSYLGKETSADDLKRIVDDYTQAALAIGQKCIIAPWIGPELRSSLDDYKYVAQKLNEVGQELQKSNLTLGYHNHDFEFQDFDGQTGYDIFLAETDADKVKLELDLYWAVRSEKDPAKLFAEHPGRFSYWHVKDMDKADHSLNTEIGNGGIDYSAIFKHAKLSGLEYLFVEQENFKIDPIVSITSSADYVKNTLLKEI